MSAIDWSAAAPAVPYGFNGALKSVARRAGFAVALIMATATAYAAIAVTVLVASGILAM